MFESYLDDLLKKQSTVNAYHLGGTLCLDGIGPYYMVTFRMDGEGSIVVNSGDDWKKFSLTQREKYLVARLYLANKTDKHAFYEDALNLVRDYHCE